MKLFNKFEADDSGAITVDWVVLTAAIVGMGIAVLTAVSSGINDAATDINDETTGAGGNTVTAAITGIETITSTEWNGMSYWDYRGIAEQDYGAAGNAGATAGWIATLAAADAPAGFNYDNPLIDTVTSSIVYTSNDGNSYSVNGQVTAIAGYTNNVGPI